MRIAMCTGNASLFASVKTAFEEDGTWTCVKCDNPLSLIKYLGRNHADLVLLDAGNNFTPFRAVFDWRSCHFSNKLPIMVIGQYLDRKSMTDAFSAGADDVVAGSISTWELLVRARHRIACGVHAAPPDDYVHAGNYWLDRRVGAAYRDGVRVPLTPREFAIAWLLFSNVGALISRDQLALAVWGKDFSLIARTLEQHIYKLRTKLNLGKDADLELTSVYSRGYRLALTNSERVDGYVDKAALETREHRGGAPRMHLTAIAA